MSFRNKSELSLPGPPGIKVIFIPYVWSECGTLYGGGDVCRTAPLYRSFIEPIFKF